jgi:hypothetical protein
MGRDVKSFLRHSRKICQAHDENQQPAQPLHNGLRNAFGGIFPGRPIVETIFIESAVPQMAEAAALPYNGHVLGGGWPESPGVKLFTPALP